MKRALLVALPLLFPFGLTLVACKTAPEARPDAVGPSVPEQELAVMTQSLTDCTLKYTATVEAGSEGVFVDKAVWEFVVDGTVLKHGESPLSLNLAAGAKAPLALEQNLTYVKDGDDLKAMDARGGSLLIALRGNLIVKVTTPAQGDVPAKTSTVELPFAHAKEVRTPRLPHVKLQDFEAGRFSESEMQVIFHIGVVNPNPFQISLSGLSYEVQLAGKKITDGNVGAGERVSQASTGVFDVTATMNEETHGKDVQRLIKTKIIPYVLSGEMKTAFHTEALDAKGDIKLNISKER